MRISKRERLAGMLDRSGSLRAVLRMGVPWLTILTYHRFPERDGDEPFDDGVIDTTRGEFERQIAYVKKHCTVVGVDELCAFAAGAKLPRNPVAIAFDDGYLGNYEEALPILKRHDCRAIFFVSTSFITERRVYWWDRVAYVMKTSPRREIVLEYPFFVRLDLTGPRDAAIRHILRIIKTHRSLDIERFLNHLSAVAKVPWSAPEDRRFADRLLMTWDHIRALKKAGMDVQSHTRTHRVLQTLTRDELADELIGSRDDLRRELGDPVRALAYPVGQPLGSDSPIRAALQKFGYEIGLTNGTGPTSLRRPVDNFDICRQTVERNFSEALFSTMLALPRLGPRHPWQLPANVVR